MYHIGLRCVRPERPPGRPKKEKGKDGTSLYQLLATDSAHFQKGFSLALEEVKAAFTEGRLDAVKFNGIL